MEQDNSHTTKMAFAKMQTPQGNNVNDNDDNNVNDNDDNNVNDNDDDRSTHPISTNKPSQGDE